MLVLCSTLLVLAACRGGKPDVKEGLKTGDKDYQALHAARLNLFYAHVSDSFIRRCFKTDSFFKTVKVEGYETTVDAFYNIRVVYYANIVHDTNIKQQLPNDTREVPADNYDLKTTVQVKGLLLVDNTGQLHNSQLLDTLCSTMGLACGKHSEDTAICGFDDPGHTYFSCESVWLFDEPFGKELKELRNKRERLQADIITEYNKGECDEQQFAHIRSKERPQGYWVQVYIVNPGHEYVEGLGTHTTYNFNVSLVTYR